MGRKETASLQSQAKIYNWGNLAFAPLLAAMIGLFIAAADGLICRVWRRVLLAGAVGMVIGCLGGFVFGSILANMLYGSISMMAHAHAGEGVGGMTATGFLIQLSARRLGWGLAGMSMGLGQGIALRSGRLLLYGFLGGLIGGLLGGLLFDPVQLFIVGEESLSAHWARLTGMVVVGLGVGVMIGIVELLARDAWLNMVEGPLAGKEFLIFKDMMQLGASPRSDIYLFNDEEVADRHAVIQASGDHYEIQSLAEFHPVLVDGQPVTTRRRLRHGSQITLGKTIFVFHQRRTS